jgi:hypothetical protein
MTTRHSIGIGHVVVVDGQGWTVRVVLTTPAETERDLEKIRLEIDRLLASWIKTKIEKG